MFEGHAYKLGWKYTTLICDSQRYMQYLMSQFEKVHSSCTAYVTAQDSMRHLDKRMTCRPVKQFALDFSSCLQGSTMTVLRAVHMHTAHIS